MCLLTVLNSHLKPTFQIWVSFGECFEVRQRIAGPAFKSITRCKRKEVHSMTGVEVVESILAIFHEVTPTMNLCMQIQV